MKYLYTHDGLETLKQFEERTSKFIYNSIPEEGDFYTSEGLKQKVISAEEAAMSESLSKEHIGKLKKYGGNTIVFPLEQGIIKHCEWMQKYLYEKCDEILAEKLDSKTFHVTLHDLVNGPDIESMKEQMDEVCRKALECLKYIQEMGMDSRIYMETTCVFNMASTSVVLGLKPVVENSCNKLMMLYEMFQKVAPLNYPLTPHITLAYFKPGQYKAVELESLRNVIDQLNNWQKQKVVLDIKKLCYMEFSDMNHYCTKDIFSKKLNVYQIDN